MSDVQMNQSNEQEDDMDQTAMTVNGKATIDITDQTFTTTEYAISAISDYNGSMRRFFAEPAYGNFSMKLSEATRYKTFTEALDKVDVLKKYHCNNLQIHEIIIDVRVGRTVSA